MSAEKSRNLSIKQRGLMSFETVMWVFTRLSALAMYAFIIFGLIGALVMGARNNMNFAEVMRWGFMPNVTHVEDTDIPDTAPWSTPFWKLVASGLLIIAVGHGVHGLVVIADDYIVKAKGRQIVRIISGVMILSMIVLGLYLIWTS
jgi:succinate dehydrogenase hydrophobic anchor subunit